MNRIYLDYNATTPLSPEVKEFYIQELERYANGSSLHEDGRLVARHIEKARQQVAGLIHAEPGEIFFTSGGSESNNTVFNTMAQLGRQRKRNVIVTTAVEHPCVLEASKRLAGQFGMEVIYLPVDEYGVVKSRDFDAAMEKQPLLVSVMTANNEIGTVQDIPELCRKAHAAGALFHTDAVQAAGKIPVDMKGWDVDYATFSAHKIYGPKGIGALFVKKGVPVEPLIRGGHQEHGVRAGTYNGPAIAGYGFAAERAAAELDQYGSHTSVLRNRLRTGLLERMLGVDASTGSACASASLDPSHVLLATGLGPELAHGSIRFSFGKYNTAEEVDYILEYFPPVIEKLRKMSTVSYRE